MTTLARTAGIAGSLVSAAAVAVAVILPTHHAPTVSGTGMHTTAGTAAVPAGTSGSGSGQSSGTAGSTGAAGGSSGTGASGGLGSGSTGSAGSGSSGSGGAGSSGGSPSGSTSGGSGSGSTGTGGWHTVHPIIPSLPHLPITVVSTIPSPTGTIGDPGVPCLQGYVWRQAYAGDYVCVTPATRTEAAQDNAAAVSRVQAGGGAYGPYTCVQGYVWRQVVSNDYTCVTPAVRAAAAYDNSQAASRVAQLDLWVTDWTPPSQPTQNCSGGVCTTTSGGWDGPNFQINGDLFNFGPVVLQVHRDDGSLVWSTTVTARTYTGFPGGALYAQTPIGDCSSVPGTTDNDYVIAYDTVSGRWSARLPIDSDCASF